MAKTLSFSERRNSLREILNSHELGYRTSHDETITISSFFRDFHPDWYEKTHGLSVITYIITPVYSHNKSGRCFYLLLENGETNDIGYGTLTAKPKDPQKYARNNVALACRYAIDTPCIKPLQAEISRKFKEGIPVYSEYSNELISNFGDVHIDHYDCDFNELLSRWIDLKGLDYLFSQVNMGEHSTITKFIDDNLNEEFVKFHNLNTHLRVVTKNENLSVLRKN